jgi:hypothetical protein
MTGTIKGRVVIGWDARDAEAYRVALYSMWSCSDAVKRGDIKASPILLDRLRAAKLYFRPVLTNANGQKFDVQDGRTHSTDFTYSRFLAPFLSVHAYPDTENEPVLFIDPDVMFFADVEELFKQADPEALVQVVQRPDYEPQERLKMQGLKQTSYPRKNWSSVMLFPRPKDAAALLHPRAISERHREELHNFDWCPKDELGELTPDWNWLDGIDDPEMDPSLVHFTLGTPDLEPSVDSIFAANWWEALSLSGSAYYPPQWGMGVGH